MPDTAADTLSDADTMTERQVQPAAVTTPDWIVYQIGGPDRNKFRFIVAQGFQDVAVEKQLREGEFIDTTTALLGEFGGDVTVLPPNKLNRAAKAVVLEASDLLHVLGAAVRRQDFALVTPELAMRLQEQVNRLRPLVDWNTVSPAKATGGQS